jgi:hypothetical protein
MAKEKLKKFIAREGLIILGFILAYSIVIGLIKLAYHIFYLFTKPRLYDDLLIFEPFNTIKNIVFLIGACGYPLYLLIRFIIWAMRTLNLEIKLAVAKKALMITGAVIFIIIISLVAYLRYDQERPKGRNLLASSDIRENWRKLKRGMTEEHVRNILGEPDRTTGGTSTHWYYQKSGKVEFFANKVTSWQEPY